MNVPLLNLPQLQLLPVPDQLAGSVSPKAAYFFSKRSFCNNCQRSRIRPNTPDGDDGGGDDDNNIACI